MFAQLFFQFSLHEILRSWRWRVEVQRFGLSILPSWDSYYCYQGIALTKTFTTFNSPFMRFLASPWCTAKVACGTLSILPSWDSREWRAWKAGASRRLSILPSWDSAFRGAIEWLWNNIAWPITPFNSPFMRFRPRPWRYICHTLTLSILPSWDSGATVIRSKVAQYIFQFSLHEIRRPRRRFIEEEVLLFQFSLHEIRTRSPCP